MATRPLACFELHVTGMADLCLNQKPHSGILPTPLTGELHKDTAFTLSDSVAIVGF